MHQLSGVIPNKSDLLIDFWGSLEKSIEQFSGKDLLVTKSGGLTFAQAWSTANAISRQIQNQNITSNIAIGIYFRDPGEIVPCMLAAMKSRDHFVVLDVMFPEHNIISMVESAGIKIILTSDAYVEKLRRMIDTSVVIINIDQIESAESSGVITVNYSPEDIVQILFTSGSTGTPKGVIEDYRYLVRSIFARREAYKIVSSDKILRLTSLSSTGPHLDVFISLFFGSTVYFHDTKVDGFSNLPDWINANKITLFAAPPSTFRSFVEVLSPDVTFPSIRFFGSGGEKRLHKDMVAVKKYFPGVKEVGLSYGSTEVPFIATSRVNINTALKYSDLPSGIPNPDVKVLIQDESGKNVTRGNEGEIVVYGDSLARGYLNEHALTKEKFIQDPQNPGWQYFKTGDVGKILPDGQLMHLGRIDKMVKIRGVRIEMDSIEKITLGFPGISRAASKVITDVKGSKKIAIYFTAIDNLPVPLSALRKALAEKLPIQQLPNYLIQMEEFPITGSGKIDLENLPLPQTVRPDLQNSFIAPSTKTERILKDIWEDAIGIAGIGITDDFLEVGGDSLIGAIIFETIKESFGVTLPLSILLTTSTIQKLAKKIDGANTPLNLPVIPINPKGSGLPIFFIPGKGGYPVRIRHLAKKFDEDVPFYAFQNDLNGEKEENLRSVEQVAEKYLSMIKQIQPNDGFILVGESLGGKIAFEVAQQAVAEGKKPPMIFLLDSFNDEAKPEPYKIKGSTAFYSMLFRKHSSIWFRSNWEGKKEYLRFYSENFLRKTSNAFSIFLKKFTPKNRPALPSKYSELENNLVLVTDLYRPKSYSGEVILVKALRESKNTSPDNGWQTPVNGEFFIEPLDCYHGSILFEPAVSKLAEIIKSYTSRFSGKPGLHLDS